MKILRTVFDQTFGIIAMFVLYFFIHVLLGETQWTLVQTGFLGFILSAGYYVGIVMDGEVSVFRAIARFCFSWNLVPFMVAMSDVAGWKGAILYVLAIAGAYILIYSASCALRDMRAKERQAYRDQMERLRQGGPM